MFSVVPSGEKILQNFSFFCGVSRAICSRRFSGDIVDNGYGCVEDYLSESWKNLDFDRGLLEKLHNDFETHNSVKASSSYDVHCQQNFSPRKSFIDNVRNDARKVLEILQQDGPGFDAKAALDGLQVRVSGLLVREVLLGILKTVSYVNKSRSARLGFKFFVWSAQQENYRHTANAYHLILKIFAEAEEFKAMWRLVDEMIEKGKGDKPLAALNLLNHMKEVGCEPSVLHFTTLIDGLSRAGNLEACNYFFDQMIKHGGMPDVVCYTVMITGYVVAGEIDKAQEMFNDMINKGQLPNVFTYNSMIRGLCMADKFEEACVMLKEMETRGCNPNFLVYTTLVSYLRNAGKLSEAHDVIRHMVEKGQYIHLLSKIKKYRRC